MTYPKILFLADEIPQSKNAGSILFFRLFNEYPSDKLLIVGRKPLPNATILKCKYLTLTFSISDKIRTSIFRTWQANLEAIGIKKYTLPKITENQINDFEPDIVISLMQLYMYYSCAYQYAKKIGKPFYIFCHDDIEQFNGVGSFFKKSSIKLNSKIYQYAQKRICISKEMQDVFTKRYGVKGDVLYPIPEGNISPKANPAIRANKNQITIGYAGSLVYGYNNAIEEFAKLIEPYSIKINIYSTTPNKFMGINNINYRGGFAPKQLWEIVKSECDAVLLPYSFNNKSMHKLYETHFPSKLPEYLSLKMPVVIYGPSFATGVKWGITNPDCCFTIKDEYDAKSLVEFFNNETEINKIAINTYNKYLSHFSPTVILKQFYNLIIK